MIAPHTPALSQNQKTRKRVAVFLVPKPDIQEQAPRSAFEDQMQTRSGLCCHDWLSHFLCKALNQTQWILQCARYATGLQAHPSQVHEIPIASSRHATLVATALGTLGVLRELLG